MMQDIVRGKFIHFGVGAGWIVMVSVGGGRFRVLSSSGEPCWVGVGLDGYATYYLFRDPFGSNGVGWLNYYRVGGGGIEVEVFEDVGGFSRPESFGVFRFIGHGDLGLYLGHVGRSMEVVLGGGRVRRRGGGVLVDSGNCMEN